MPEDIAITSSKSDVDPCSHGRETDRQKSADGRTDRQTAFQLYIVEFTTVTMQLQGDYLAEGFVNLN